MLQELKKIRIGSTWLNIALWSLLFLLTVSCRKSASEDFALARHEIMSMDSCRIKADNLNFYLHKYKTEKLLSGHENVFASLPPAQQQEYISLKTGYTLAFTDYLLQLGNRKEAQHIITQLADNTTINLQTDSMQWLNYLYHQGKVCYMPYNITHFKDIVLRGYDCLVQCYILAKRREITRYEVLSMLVLSQYFSNYDFFELAYDFDAPSIRYINEDNVADSLLSGNLAERALNMSFSLNDPYITNEAWLNLARCYFLIGEAGIAIECLNIALDNPATDSMPDMKACLAEQMSMSYSALDDKYHSDLYRNTYLDLQDSTRQDRQFEARAYELKETTDKIWFLVAIASGVFLLLLVATIVLTRMRKHKMKENTENEEELDMLKDEMQKLRLQLSNAQRSAIEQRSQISVINGILPLIDRMRLSVEKGIHSTDERIKAESIAYAKDVAKDIEQQNAMLTRWIKMRHGIIEPKIETFQLQSILQVIEQSSSTLLKQGIRLNVPSTQLSVKADKTLTMFLINTLADNARKAMPEGGDLNILCTKNDTEQYAEITVEDTGRGMSEEQLEHIFEYKPIKDEGTTSTQHSSNATATQHPSHSGVNSTGNHGFGLQNCRGIIDRYRKISSLFSVCSIKAESELGQGTRISFRLPLAMKMLLCLMAICASEATAGNSETNEATASNNGTIKTYAETARHADSLYQCNIMGRYDEAILYADSCMEDLKIDSLANDTLKLKIYNETAIAALTRHQWDRYQYNNYLYTNLYKKVTADKTLSDYCRLMEQGEMWANITMLIVLMLIVSLAPIFWFTYLRHVIRYRKNMARRISDMKEAISATQNEYSRLHVLNNITDNQLSIVKHETMYYPARIQQMLSSESNTEAENEDIFSAITYYRELYAMLTTQVLNGSTATYRFAMRKYEIEELFPGIVYGKKLSVDKEEQPSDTSVKIMANDELITLLRTILKRHNNGKTPVYTIEDENAEYIEIKTSISQTISKSVISDAGNSLRDLFTPHTTDVDFLILRQILREIGSTTNRYACGIKIVSNDNEDNTQPTISFMLPKA